MKKIFTRFRVLFALIFLSLLSSGNASAHETVCHEHQEDVKFQNSDITERIDGASYEFFKTSDNQFCVFIVNKWFGMQCHNKPFTIEADVTAYKRRK